LPCRIEITKRPRSKLTEEQKIRARELIGKMSREDIAKEIGCSVSSLKRAFIGTRLVFFNKYVANPNLVKEVCAYYEKHGKVETQKMFPDTNIRSIVERYKQFQPRQIRWTEDQIIEAAKMGGLISISAQALFFKRPNAFEGSIKSLWYKKFKIGGQGIQGMSYWMGRHLVSKVCPIIKSGYWKTTKIGAQYRRKLYLWVDMEKHLRKDLPEFMKLAVKSMADFQKWIFNSSDPRREILRIIEDRSPGENFSNKY